MYLNSHRLGRAMDPQELRKDFACMPADDYLTLHLTAPVGTSTTESKIRKVLKGVAPGFEPDFIWRTQEKFYLFKKSVG